MMSDDDSDCTVGIQEEDGYSSSPSILDAPETDNVEPMIAEPMIVESMIVETSQMQVITHSHVIIVHQ